MRRHLVLAAAIAGVLLVSGCSSDSGTKRTVTAVVTVSSGAEVSGSADAGSVADSAAPSGSVAPSGSAAASGSTAAADSTSAAVSSAPAPPPPIVTVDPLKADCGAVISPPDVKKFFGVDMPADKLKVTVAEVNADVGQTGRVRCLYAVNPDKTSGLFTMALTQYTDAAAAQKQVEVTVANETDNGAQITPITVGGYPATMAIRDGGLVIMSYDNWTFGLAITSGDPAAIAVALPELADVALARVLKT
ncbi:MAG: hypothetical protein ABJD68_17285 [Nakamurella sp.]